MEDPWTYVVTDIEVDGPWPGPNSMRSFASVAVTAAGDIEHTHRAIDDARGYAHLLGELFRRTRGRVT